LAAARDLGQHFSAGLNLVEAIKASLRAAARLEHLLPLEPTESQFDLSSENPSCRRDLLDSRGALEHGESFKDLALYWVLGEDDSRRPS
jgi:hypothetical protein